MYYPLFIKWLWYLEKRKICIYIQKTYYIGVINVIFYTYIFKLIVAQFIP